MVLILMWVSPRFGAMPLNVAETGAGPTGAFGASEDCVLASARSPDALTLGRNWRSLLAGSAAVFGPLELSEADRVATFLQRGGDPRGSGAPDVPWALVLRRADGITLALASTMLQSGLFYTERADPDRQLLVATNPGALLSGSAQRGELDEDFVRSQAAMTVDARRTPFKNVRRLPPGSALWWRDRLGTGEIEWLTPGTFDPPTLRGDQAIRRFRQSFDSVLSDALPRSGTLVAQMSGGLDSTFVVASLARLTNANNPVHAYVHAPAPEAPCRTEGIWDPDDSDVAMAMARAYPETVLVSRVVNDDGQLALDAAAEASSKSFWPTLNPANAVWMEKIGECARRQGAKMLYAGMMGNYTFSYDHGYALGYELRRGSLPGAFRAATNLHRGGDSWPRIVRTEMSKARHSGLGSRPGRDYATMLGIPVAPSGQAADERRSPREEWLARSLNRVASYSAALSPAALGGLLVGDPFAATCVLEVAAAIEPSEWLRGPGRRGYARLLGEGSVPDEIRLRTRRARQSSDAWWHMRNARERYQDEAQSLATTAILGGWIDHRKICALVASWPWGEPLGPRRVEITGVDRILSLAAYIRMMEQRPFSTSRSPG